MCGSCNECSTKNGSLPLITGVYLITTERCNLACKYCYVHQNPKEMTYEVAKRAVDMIYENSLIQGDTPFLNFFGGEPLLKYEEIVKPIVNYIRSTYPADFWIGITTNGVLLTEEILKFLVENNVGLLLSVDGKAEIQNINRPFHDGRGSFDKLDAIIPKALEYFPVLTFRGTLNNDTACYMMDSVLYAVEKGYDNMFIIPNILTDWTAEQEAILVEQVKQLGDYYIQEARNGKLLHFIPLEEKIKDIISINRAVREGSFDKTAKNKCGLGSNRYASVSPTGNLYGCQEYTNNQDDNIFLIGNVFDGTDDVLRIELISKFNNAVIEGDNCSTCPYNPICSGHCVANNYIANGSLTKVPRMWCVWTRALLEQAIRITRTLGEEKNELFKNGYFS